MTSNQCSKYPPGSFIHSFILDAIRKIIMQYSNQHKAVYSYPTLQILWSDSIHESTIYENAININLSKRHLHFCVMVQNRENSCKKKKKRNPSNRDPSPLCVFPFLLTGVFSMIHINYLQSMCPSFGIGHFSKIFPIFWNLSNLHKY